MNVTKDLVEQLTQLRVALLDARGHELLNPRPVQMPTSMQRPLSLQEQIRRVLRTELSRQADAQGHETFDEANDFEVLDEFDIEPPSQYTMDEEFLRGENDESGNNVEDAGSDVPDVAPEGTDGSPGESGESDG